MSCSTNIELEPDQFGFVCNKNGELVEFYLPDLPDDATVPNNIVQIMEILLKNETNKI